MNIRGTIFWILDLLTGGKVRKQVMEINSTLRMGNNDNKQLSLLLEHASRTVPAYSNQVNKGLNDFPVLTKDDYKRDSTLYCSAAFLGKKLHKMSTSGSTGTPFTVIQDINKRNRSVADLMHFNRIEGQELGDKFLFIKAWAKKKSRLESIKQNMIAVDILRLTNDVMEQLRTILKKDKKIKSVLGYASSYDMLVNYLIDKGEKPGTFNVDVLFSGASILSEETKKKLELIFRCPVIDRYSNQENGILAQTRPYDNIFHVNHASYYIELLKINSDEHACVGEIGRIVVTDLYNFAFPMIRYDTGDLAVSDDANRNGLKTLRNIQGRRVDIIYDTKGNTLTPHTWSVHMRKYQHLRQWQFIQEGRNKYILKVNGGKGVYEEGDFISNLRSILGEDADIEVQYVDEIPVLSSGKFKNTICNYQPELNENVGGSS